MTVVDIPDGAEEDLPPDNGTPGRAQQVEDPAGKHSRWVDKYKHTFAIGLVSVCVLMLVALAVVEYYLPKEAGGFNEIQDSLKFFATIGLGFLFGQAVAPSKQ